MSFWDGATGNWANNFSHPNAHQANVEELDNIQWNLTLGADRWPTFDSTSTQECFYRLRLARQANQGSDSLGISSHLYRANKFIVAQSLEKAPGSSAHLALNFKNMGAITTVHVVLHYEQILNVSAAGAEVLD